MANLANTLKSFFGTSSRKNFNILSIDGGGIKGVFPTQLLTHIQEDLGIDLYSYFDLIVGTSTGSIIASSLATGYPLSGVMNMYEHGDEKVFRKNRFSFKGIARNVYSNEVFKEETHKVLGEVLMSQTKTPLILTSADINEARPVIFNCYSKDVKVADAVIASCSAPIYFKPHKIGSHYYVDGGIWANNPSILAISQAVSIYKQKIENISLLSLGTGIDKSACFGENTADLDKSNWGVMQWSKCATEFVLQISKKGYDSMASSFLDNNRYIRLNFVAKDHVSMDSTEFIPVLKKLGTNVFKRNKRKLEKFFS